MRISDWSADVCSSDLDSGLVHASVSGRAVKDPTFGLEALWIPAEQKDQAVASGYTVVDASTVVATHVNQILQSQSCQLLGQDEVQKLLDTLQEIGRAHV